MPPSRRRTNRRQRRFRPYSSSSTLTTVQNYSDTFEHQLATRKDRITLRGKQYYNQTWTSVQFIDTIDASSFTAISQQFERWRVVKLVFKPVTITSTSATDFAYGITDDPEVSSTISFSQITQLRVNNVAAIGPSTDLATLGVSSGEFVWTPVDPDKWYYTTTISGGDIRFAYPGSFVAATSGTTQTVHCTYILYFVLEFEGQI